MRGATPVPRPSRVRASGLLDRGDGDESRARHNHPDGVEQPYECGERDNGAYLVRCCNLDWYMEPQSTDAERNLAGAAHCGTRREGNRA